METEACHLVDKIRGVRVCRLLTQVTCSSEDWRCRNGFCVSSEARCDGYIHCYDRSDEMHCGMINFLRLTLTQTTSLKSLCFPLWVAIWV